MTEPRSPRVLVLYFSRTGATRLVAEAIARASSGDCEELREARSRRGIWGWLRSGYEATHRKPSAPLPLAHDPRAYDLVFLGSPTWAGTMCSPVRGFLLAQGRELPSLALFATCQRRGADEVLAEMAELAGKQPIARLALLEADARRGPAVEVGELLETAYSVWELRRAASKSCAERGAGLAGSPGHDGRAR